MWIIVETIQTKQTPCYDEVEIRVHDLGYHSREKAMEMLGKGVIEDGWRHADNIRKQCYSRNGGSRSIIFKGSNNRIVVEIKHVY